MDWLSHHYAWLFDGVGGAAAVALLAYLAQRLFGSKSQPAGVEATATLTAQGAKVIDSPVASGSGITQIVNSPTIYVGNSELDERKAALLTIHSKLEEALFYLQRAASSSKFQGEASDQELLQRMGRNLAAASTEYSQNKLLISVPLTRKIDAFFNKVVSAGMTLNVALDPMTPNGEPRAKLWDQAREIAYKEIPPILEAIQAEARAEIRGPSSR